MLSFPFPTLLMFNAVWKSRSSTFPSFTCPNNSHNTFISLLPLIVFHGKRCTFIGCVVGMPDTSVGSVHLKCSLRLKSCKISTLLSSEWNLLRYAKNVNGSISCNVISLPFSVPSRKPVIPISFNLDISSGWLFCFPSSHSDSSLSVSYTHLTLPTKLEV